MELFAKIFSAAAVVLGGGWAFYRFFLFTEYFPKLNFNVDVIPKLRHRNHHICEVVAEVENIGSVRVEIRTMSFSLHGLHASDEIDETNEAINFQMMFPAEIKKAHWFPPHWENSFVETKTKQTYRHICSIPANVTAVVLHGTIEYNDTFHTANKLVALKTNAEAG